MLCQRNFPKNLLQKQDLNLNSSFALLPFMPTVHLLIKGKVQGVFYRVSARKTAQALDLKGWVRNTKEGHVESVASGSDKALQQYIEWCRKGPEKAAVSSVQVTSIEDEAFADFQIRRG